jgi:hypothetical protein
MRRLSLLAVLLALPAMGQGYRPTPGWSMSSTPPVRTGEDFVRTGLGQDVSFEKVTVTGTCNTCDAINVLSGKIRMAPSTVSSGALFWFDSGTGFNLGSQLLIAAGGAMFADYLVPRQNALPLTLGDSDGTTMALQASPGTCDAAHKGAIVGVTESATSATRLCRCIRTSDSGNYRWLNMDNATRGSTTTDCPDTAP